MTFTKDIPTTPGFYAWRLCSIDIPSLHWVTSDGETLWRDGKHPATNGEWCRLVPAEEVEKAWGEALRTWKPWKDSRAKRVMEGRE